MLKLSLEFAESERRPGETNRLSVMASPQSLVSLLAIDKSVQLLKSGNDITQNEVRCGFSSSQIYAVFAFENKVVREKRQ
jgi:CD109 antigen